MKRIVLFLIICCLLLLSPAFEASASEPYGKVYCRNAMCKGKIALTFDDGPHPRYTKEILGILEEYHVKATFFVIGINALHYPDDLQKIIDAGCEIGNHTYSHPRIKELSEEELQKQIVECEDTLDRLCGIRPHIFRPPEGMMNEGLKRLLKEMDYHAVLWSIDTMDWDHHSPQKIAAEVLGSVRSGDIILMHDYIGHNSPTVTALELMIPKLLERGFEFVTVSELIGIEN